MKFAFIQTEKAAVPISTLCHTLKVSRSGFYAWQDRAESEHAKKDRELRVKVRASFDAYSTPS